MNFLAHSIFSPDEALVRISNLLGDVFKGNVSNISNPIIKKGVVIHRALDTYIDHHPNILTIKNIAQPYFKKYTGIAVDMAYDIYISKLIESKKVSIVTYHQNLARQFQLVYNLISPQQQILGNLIFNNQWILSYGKWNTMNGILQQMNQRVKHKTNFLYLEKLYQKEEKLFCNHFDIFTSDCLSNFESAYLK